MKAFVQGAARPVSAMRVLLAGALRKVTRVRQMRGGALAVVAQFSTPLTGATASPDTAGANGSGRKPKTLTTNSVTAIPTGGSAPFTYSWSIASGTGVSITSPGSASTTFQGSNGDAVARCLIADTFGNTATCDVTVSIVFDLEL